MDKLNYFREFQFLRYLKKLDINMYEIEKSRTACKYYSDSNNDLVFIYNKKIN